jgi:iron complex outermembrane receptor protein
MGKIETIVAFRECTKPMSGEEYLIPDAVTNDFGCFGTANYEWKSNVLQADCVSIIATEARNCRRRRFF